MSDGAALNRTRILARLAATGLVGIWLSGCSSDSTRLTESFSNPFSNPFSTASNDAPAPAQNLASAKPTANLAAAAHSGPVAVAALPPSSPATTGAIKNSNVQTASSNGWRAAGGSPIVVADGDTIDTLSRRYGVPTAALLHVNGFTSASDVHAGTRLIVPVYDAGTKAADASAEPKKAAHTAQADDASATKTPKSKNSKHTKADAVADAQADAPAKPHDKAKALKIDAAKTGGDKPVVDAKAAVDIKGAKPAPQVAQADAASKAAAPGKKKPVDNNATTGSVHAEEPAPTTPLTGAQADASGVAPEFRWPARGRIIQGFKTGGNDGINIAVPEGTSVKAAESGVVAYAGSELKGYGNLVLIRHPNGFVSAYANNGELDVKRGETVKRGQIIAKSGQSGNVNSPQLHFELRKGSTPVDPTSYLAGL
jgi:murein DD-endopeptidase MepM/ murein hydrolase activator NlpD